MMMLACWVRNIRGRWFKPAPLFLAAWLAAGMAQTAPSLTSLARAYRESPTAARRDALLRHAAAHPKGSEGALALLAVGATEVERGDHASGAARLEAALARLPQISDFVSFRLAEARLAQRRLEEALKHAAVTLKSSPASPLAGEAAILAARTHMTAGAPGQAIAVLKEYAARLPQPEGDWQLALAYEADGQPALAASSAQKVYYGYPASGQAADAERMLARLREQLGPGYPPPTPAAMLERAEKWMQARDYRRARAEYLALAPQLGGAGREAAQVRAGAAALLNGNTREAESYLQSLSLATPPADAERLYYLVRCARSLGKEQEMLDLVSRLSASYPDSPWRLEALVWAGNHYVLRNDAAGFAPLFRACYENFPGETAAAYCHWKVTWSAYMARLPEAAALLREHGEKFPDSDKRAAAWYFQGRLSESASNRPAAVPLYRRILEEYPNHYYAILAAERLRPGERPPAKASALSFVPDAVNQQRINRSRLLATAALYAWAARELRFAAQEDGQPHVLAAELARQARGREAYGEGIRHIKAVFPAYLKTPLEPATEEMWRLAFPIPYRPQLETYVKAHQLDLFLLAGLIRQESEFDPRAVSRAGARGLMQVMPSTGKQISQKLRLGGFRTGLLESPAYNIRLGTYYFRYLLDQHEGSVEAALASYNGGKTRVEEWLGWGPFQEPAEFVETIPLTETRTYVQAVLRNAWMYRRIYSKSEAAPAKK